MLKYCCLLIAVLSVLASSGQTETNWSMFHGCVRHCGVNPAPDNLKVGTLKWKFKNDAKSYSSPAVLYDLVYFGSQDQKLYALNSQTGKVVWKFKT